MDDKEAFEIALAENIQRKSLDPVEEATAFKTYVEQLGWGGVKTLAEKIGKSPEYVSHRISLLNLPKDVLEDVRAGNISVTAAYELLGLTHTSDHEQTEIAKDIASFKFSSREVRQIVRASRKESRNVTTLSEDNYKFVNQTGNEEDATRKIIRSAIIIHRISLVRLDKLINECRDQSVKDFLLSQRIRIHSFIDECISYRKISGSSNHK
jgi:ParB family chromosome partitioning protein